MGFITFLFSAALRQHHQPRFPKETMVTYVDSMCKMQNLLVASIE